MATDILVIDDEVEICEVLQSLLEDEGYSTKAVNDALTALSVVETEKTPLLICDISMPGKSGLSLLEDLRKKNLPCAVVMLTAHSESEKIITALQLGAVDYIVKPFDSTHIVASLPTWLEIGKRLQSTLVADKSPESLIQQLRMIELFRIKNHARTKSVS